MSSKLVRQARRFLLGAVIVTAGLGHLPVQAQVSNAQVGALVEALRLAAPQTGTENDGLYSEWQIKPENIPRWSKQCIGRQLSPADFEASPVTARAILVCVMGDILKEQYSASGNNESVAVQRAAAWWMTGDASRYSSAPTNSYTQNVLNFYQQQRRTPQTQQPATPPQPTETQAEAKPATTQTQTTTGASSTREISDVQVDALVEALRLAAPQTGTQNDGLYSEWQIKADNIPRWSKQCTGQELTPAVFEGNPTTARTVVACVMRDILKEQYSASENNLSMAVRRAASWWMTGDPSRYKSGSTADYTQRVLSFYRESFLKFFPHL
ncbi:MULTISPECIES: hypothetical protein [unclassified Coleofasciculus]|uniref:hypothetical protein n=1 Tax=unclassified Coleofasciculus TaxID=2692782 RepID=UPI001880421A|nr:MULTISPECIES: hypothetical protein [unclassified Coleofasciculus]MBE9129779.1 hypothetical protein [Coleofasciculus sp. LEGE 07081]MBE9150380.1 hypothetical protein [Coleofasciculus sp. LEGE 07092]